MSMQRALELLQKVAGDKDLAARLEQAAGGGGDAGQKVLQEHGFGDVTQGHLVQALIHLAAGGAPDGAGTPDPEAHRAYMVTARCGEVVHSH